MNLKTKIVIDRFFGFFLIQICKLFFKTNNGELHEFNNIIISKYKGLGSIIQVSPLLQTIKQNYPNSKIIFVTEKANKSLLDIYCQIVDEAIYIDDISIISLGVSFFKSVFRIRRFSKSIFIDLEIYSNLGKINTLLSGTSQTLGFNSDVKNVYSNTIEFNSDMPISDLYLQFAPLLGCKNQVINLYKPYVESENFNYLKNEKYIVINPNASELRIERRWHTKSFGILINQILKQNGIKIVLVGANSEVGYVQKIFEFIDDDLQNKVINLTGKSNLEELFFIIENSKLMISTDSGPMNFSLALNKKTIALFGPVNPVQYGSFTHCYPIYSKVHCSPCVHKFINPPCNGNNICMSQISVEKVLEKTLKILSIN